MSKNHHPSMDSPEKLKVRRLAILEHPQAQDCTLYRSSDGDLDVEEEELGDARLLLAGPFQAPLDWDEEQRAEYFDDCDPALFCNAYIECAAALGSSGFFQPEVGDLCASTTVDGQVVMYFVHDCSENEQGRLCVLLRDDQQLF